MFKKWTPDSKNNETYNEKAESGENIIKNNSIKLPEKLAGDSNINTILKGSKLIGDINVTCDLELSGDVEGNITSEQNSNIVIKGNCKGNIETREGNVDIEGELQNGNIIAGSNVIIAGKFNGGEVKANGRIYVNGGFNGKLEGNEIEIGSNAQGKGELLYREHISIAKGARVNVQISQVPQELKLVKNSHEENEAGAEPPSNEASGTQ